MKWLRGHRPSPALAISLIALFVALGGTGYAALKLPMNSVGTKQIKKNAVTSPKVRNGSLLAADFKSGQLPAGPAGPPGPAGTAVSYAHINSDGTVDTANSMGLTNANVSHPASGVYCFGGLSFTPHSITAIVDSEDGPGVTEGDVTGPLVFCPSSSAEVVTYDPSTITFQDYGGGFYVLFD